MVASIRTRGSEHNQGPAQFARGKGVPGRRSSTRKGLGGCTKCRERKEMQQDLSQEKEGERSKGGGAAFSTMSHHRKAKPKEDSVSGPFIHSSGSSAVTDHPLCAGPEVGAGETDVKEPQEMGEGSLGVMGIRADCLEEGNPGNRENAASCLSTELRCQGKYWSQSFSPRPGRGKSGILPRAGYPVIHSFIHSFVRASVYSTQAFAQTGRGDSDPASETAARINKCRSVSRAVEGGQPVRGRQNLLEVFVESRLPGPASDHRLPVGVRAGNGILTPPPPLSRSLATAQPGTHWLTVPSGSGCAGRVALPRGRLYRWQPGTGSGGPQVLF